MPASDPDDGRRLPSLLAHAAAWLLVTSAVVGARRLAPGAPPTSGGYLIELVHAAHALLGACLAWALTGFYAARLRRRSCRDLATLVLLHGVVTFMVLHQDVARRSAHFSRSWGGPPLAWEIGLAFVVGAIAPLATLAQAALVRRGRLVALATLPLGFAGAVLLRSLPQAIYPGVRLAGQVALATGAAFAFDAWLGPSSRRSRAVLRAAAVAATAAVLALPLYETPGLRRALADDDGAASAPLLLRARTKLEAAWRNADGDRRGRAAQASLAPTRPPLIDDRNPIVVLLTIDALRADVVFSRRHDAAIPHLARLRDTSIAFSNARTTAPSTFATLDSIFSGQLLGDLGAADENGLLERTNRGDEPRLGDLLSAGGVVTTVIQTAGWLDPGFGFCGAVDAVRPPVDPRARHARADVVASALIAEIERRPERAQFLYSHLLDAHEPYDLGGTEGTLFERYLRELTQADAAVGRVAELLEQPSLRERSVLIVSADHGESFGEHGAYGHAAGVYEDAVRVPLLIRAPGLAARDLSGPTTVLDLAPTILDLFGLSTPGAMRGITLVPALRGEPLPARSIPIESGLGVRALVLADGIKISLDPRTNVSEVYDLGADPGELDDLVVAGRAPPSARSALDAFFAR